MTHISMIFKNFSLAAYDLLFNCDLELTLYIQRLQLLLLTFMDLMDTQVSLINLDFKNISDMYTFIYFSVCTCVIYEVYSNSKNLLLIFTYWRVWIQFLSRIAVNYWLSSYRYSDGIQVHPNRKNLNNRHTQVEKWWLPFFSNETGVLLSHRSWNKNYSWCEPRNT